MNSVRNRYFTLDYRRRILCLPLATGLGNFNNVKRPLKFLARALIVAIALAVSAFAGPVLVSGLVNGSFLGGTAI